MEPPEKLLKIDDSELKEMLLNMQSSFHSKLKSIEEKIEGVGSKYHMLERKIEDIINNIKESALKVTNPKFSNIPSDACVPKFMSANCEEAYPDGSWLGDPNNSDLRVRCSINPVDLEIINNTCPTAEKMALTLLDHLFDRETQARSNISGTGKHGKEQLDPLKIYGIKCHVMYMFGISHKEWLRIRQNIDSKCRFAFRRKQKGLPLTVKGSKDRSLHANRTNSLQTNGESQSNSNLIDQAQSMIIAKTEPPIVEYLQEHELAEIIPLKLEPDGYSITFAEGIATQIIHTEHGDIQVIQGTEEQLEQLKQNHNIEILSQADILTDSVLDVTQ
ncbi:protein BANP-like [Argiope bruennichi]|uniref:protein BANP-like n=1 Tax=Argiope bruennichi TaxID=94029 RepID=UPI002494A2F7|nr:protein BANP-like [Argiope bruennichi]XP_055943122.1 protein BANP-like [Argiope bruennichi]